MHVPDRTTAYMFGPNRSRDPLPWPIRKHTIEWSTLTDIIITP